MREIILHGSLAKKYGKSFMMEVETAAEAVRALTANFKGFDREILEGAWHVVRGKTIKGGLSLGEEEIVGLRLGKAPLHILPYVAGSKNGGVLKLVLGIALIGISFGFAAVLGGAIMPALLGATTWGSAIGSIGLSLALSGVSTLLTPEAKPVKEEKGSYTSSGPRSTNREGSIIPVVYGEVITGGVLVSGGIDIRKAGTKPPEADEDDGA